MATALFSGLQNAINSGILTTLNGISAEIMKSPNLSLRSATVRFRDGKSFLFCRKFFTGGSCRDFHVLYMAPHYAYFIVENCNRLVKAHEVAIPSNPHSMHLCLLPLDPSMGLKNRKYHAERGFRELLRYELEFLAQPLTLGLVDSKHRTIHHLLNSHRNLGPNLQISILPVM